MKPGPPVTNTVIIALAVRLRGLARMLAPFGPPWQSARGTLDRSEKPASVEAPTLFPTGRGRTALLLSHGAKKEAACVSTAASSPGRKRPKRAYAASWRRIARN
jgi:hypothetical protein